MDFIADIEEIRKRARRHIEDGLLTQDYRLNRDQVVTILNDALATEYLCVLRNRFHYFHGDGDSFYWHGERLLQHAQEEQETMPIRSRSESNSREANRNVILLLSPSAVTATIGKELPWPT